MDMGKAVGTIIDYDVGSAGNVCVIVELGPEENEMYCRAEVGGNIFGQLGESVAAGIPATQ